jgi:glycogen debranching enzyme
MWATLKKNGKLIDQGKSSYPNGADYYSDETVVEGRLTKIKATTENLHWLKEYQTYCDATIEKWEHTSICHKGYISLFLFLTGLLCSHHPHLDAILNLISNGEGLWSPYGIRSLSRKSPLYGTGKNYWEKSGLSQHQLPSSSKGC